MPEGCGTLTLECPDQSLADNSRFVLIAFKQPDGSPVRTWPTKGSAIAKMALPEGEYKVFAAITPDEGNASRVYTEDGWEPPTEIEQRGGPVDGAIIEIKAGETFELSNEGLLD